MATKTTAKAKTTTKAKVTATNTDVSRLKTQYTDTFRGELAKELGININEVPKLRKISVNVGIGQAKDDKKLLVIVANTLAKITGQQPVPTTSRLSIATFKLREGSKIGMMVTLRGDQMYEFMDRVVNIVLPRLRDFHGVSNKSFDGQGNFSIGFRDQSVFPELTFEETSTPHGLQVNFVIDAVKPEHAKALLDKFGMPFMKEGK
ncbi:MAG: large subunit ribosomal protein L5 [Candidatus Saccharimonadales bacterium]|jgi:large subunit ribosomal protein L5